MGSRCHYGYFLLSHHWFPWWLSGKESTCKAEDAGDVGSIPGLRRSLGERKSYPLQQSGHGLYVHGIAKSWTQLSDFHFLSLIYTSIPPLHWHTFYCFWCVSLLYIVFLFMYIFFPFFQTSSAEVNLSDSSVHEHYHYLSLQGTSLLLFIPFCSLNYFNSFLLIFGHFYVHL